MRRPKIMMEIDREVGAAVLALADYASRPSGKKTVIEKAYSLLLMGLQLDETYDTLDAFERILTDLDLANEFQRERLFSEFLTINTLFHRRYKRYKYLLKDLEDILPADLREFAENIYSVEWSRHGDVLMVS